MKKFRCGTDNDIYDLGRAVLAGFAYSIQRNVFSVVDYIRLFDNMEVGQTIVDEDGDGWERIE